MPEPTNKNGNIVKILIQSGLTGIALVSLWMVYSLSKDFSETLKNHLNHNTATLIELKGSIDQTNRISEAQTEVLRGQVNAINKLGDAVLQLQLRK